MHQNNFSDELSIDLLTHDLNSRSFLMYLRRENEKNREISTFQHNHQYSSNDNSCNFSRINKYHNLFLNSIIPSHMITQDGLTIIDDLNKQLLNDSSCIIHRHWEKSKMTFSNKIKHVHTDLNSHINISLKKAMYGCQGILFNWISKNRLK